MTNRLPLALFALPAALCASLYSTTALAQTTSLVDVCSGLNVNMPVLEPVATGVTGLLQPLADVLDARLDDAISGKTLGLSVLDTNGQVVSTGTACGLSTDSVVIDNNAGISLGGGQLSGLGGTSGAAATAGEANSIAIGNGASTDASAAGAVALGLRGLVSTSGGVALGSDSVADRAGMNGAAEAYTGIAITSTAGAVSVGATGSERQITNVAGGTQDTDAVNLRQLRAVNDGLSTRIDGVEADVTVLQQDMNTVSGNIDILQGNIVTVANSVDTLNQNVTTISTQVNGLSTGMTGVAAALGGGASYDTTTNVFTGPSYTLRGNTYTDVGTALNALNSAIGGAGTNGAVAGNNTTGLPDAVATGSDATALGYGASASHANSTAIGRGATTTRDGQIMIGTASNTYTMPGVTSAASRAAQSGTVQVLTTDSAGNIATSDVDLIGMQTDMAGLRGAVSKLSGDMSDLRRESRQGIAAAMAMAGAPKPSAPGKTAWATNVASYKGEVATSFSLSHMVDAAYPVILDASVGYAPGGSAGVRLGVSGEF